MNSNLPPGVTDSMIPGNRPEDERWERLLEQVEASDVYMPIHWDPDRVVVVLNDGETYSRIRGCKILFIPKAVKSEEWEQYVLSLKNLLPPV